MKYTIAKTSIVLLLFISHTVRSQLDNGTVVFDCPNVPSSEFQFDLNRGVLALVMADPVADIAQLFHSVDNLHLRNYRSRSVNFKEMVQYYGETLKERGWNALGQNLQSDSESDNFYLYTLRQNETVNGIFVIVKSAGDVYLINIVGEIPHKQVGELLLNLTQLGIEIPELMLLKPRDLALAPPTPPSPTSPRPEPVKTDAVLPVIAKAESGESPLQGTPEPTASWNWAVDGEPIHEIRLQDFNDVDRHSILKILDSGSGDIKEVMPIMAGALRNNSRHLSLRIIEAGSRRSAILTLNKAKRISILKSLTISESGRGRVHKSHYDKFVPQESDAQVPPAATRFLAGDAPIHEISIRGNQKVPEARIRQTLENGSEDIEQALKTLFEVMPYFKEVTLQVDAEGAMYVATITFDEKPLSTDAYLGLRPPLRLGFNRVTGWEIGTGVEVGRRKELGPLWAWNVNNAFSKQTSKIFGEVDYAFGNPHLHYRFGGTANWGKLYIWNLGITAQIHRATDAIAAGLFPAYNDGISIFQRVWGIPDLPNYYLREGIEVGLRWQPVMPTHAVTLRIVAESHASLQKSTDWFIFNWRSRLSVRGNPPITPGRMRSLIFQYDFNTRINSLGWYNTLHVEHSNAAVGSDFDFTRFQLHLRYAFPLENNRIRARFLFGYSGSLLPIQRQFVIGGMGGLRGYPWSRQASESEGIITYNSGHTSSPYAFIGDRGFLLNVEYHYRLSNRFHWGFFKNAFAIAFLDEGQVWHVSDAMYTFDPKGNIGIGLQFGEDNSIFRLNIAKAFEAAQGIQITTAWHHSF